MNKKFYSVACLFFSLLTSVFTSCLGEHNEEDNEYLYQGYYTVGGDASQIILYQDGGGKVYLDMTSVPKPAEFVKQERFYLQFKYRLGDVSEDGNSIRGAVLFGYKVIDIGSVLGSTEAAEKNITAADSLFAVNSFDGVWAYRGYLTTVVNARASYKGGETIYPSCNLVFDADAVQSNRIRFNLCYNRHSAKEYNSSGQMIDTNGVGPYQLPCSYRLDQLDGLVPGNDSIEVTIEAKDLADKSLVKTFRLGRNDLHKGNY